LAMNTAMATTLEPIPIAESHRGPGSVPRLAAPTSWVLAALVCVVTVLGFLADSEELQHWLLVPVTLCGILVGKDAIDWLLGRMNLFDPAGIIGVLGVHFFFLAPLLHVAWDYWLEYVVPPPDWRDWIGEMAFLNLGGLLVYRFVRDLVDTQRPLPT